MLISLNPQQKRKQLRSDSERQRESRIRALIQGITKNRVIFIITLDLPLKR